MKLCIISHTEHYRTEDDQIVGWGPTINEINNLTLVFDEIYHVAMLHKGKPPPSALPYTSSKINFIELPALGGRTLGAKMSILFNIPKVISIVNKTLKKVDYFQLRTPTGIGVFLIPYLTLFIKKKGWYKYAGNWNQEKPPLGYALQRAMLKKQFRKVTINGSWPNQPSHCLTFENPCLTEQDLIDGKSIQKSKNYDSQLNFCFVGRLERDKGVERIIKAFTNLSIFEKESVGSLDIVGEGEELSYFKSIAKNAGIVINFHGALPRHKVFEIYKQSHVFLLPSSASEGFPKVIAEASCFGCVPLVSKISSISQYVIDECNGLLIEPVTTEELKTVLGKLLVYSNDQFLKLLDSKYKFADKFSFKNYNHKIMKLINSI